MSTFLRALEQAERDRARSERGQAKAAPPPVTISRAWSARPAPEALSTGAIAAHLVSLVASASFEAEQYRTLRHVVEQAHRTAGVRVVAVSGPAAGDGKTTTAVNLAGALAQAPEARVLLVDADLRHPAIASSLGFSQPRLPGLVDAVVDPSMRLGEVVRVLPSFNLSVLTAGRPPRAPYELLDAPRLAELFREARDEYDYVVVDTPPLVGLPDCRRLAEYVDTFIVVLTAHKTRRRVLEAALSAVDPAKILGIVLNGDDDAPTAEYGRHVRRHVRSFRARLRPQTPTA